MKTYKINTSTCRTLPVSGQKCPAFTDKRNSAIQQQKLITQLQNGNTIQRTGNPVLKTWWNALSADEKNSVFAKILSKDYKVSLSVLDTYFNDDTRMNVAFDQVLLSIKEQMTTHFVTLNQTLKDVGDDHLTIPAPVIKYFKKTDDCAFEIEIQQPPILGVPADLGMEVAFLQIVQSSALTGEPLERAQKYKTDHPDSEGTGWTIDRSADHKYHSPFYGKMTEIGQGGDVNDPGKFTPGNQTIPAVLKDEPSNRPLANGTSWEPHFKTCAVIRKYPLKVSLVGTVLSTVLWSFKLSKNAEGVATITDVNITQHPAGIPDELKWAARVWNEKHVGTEHREEIGELH